MSMSIIKVIHIHFASFSMEWLEINTASQSRCIYKPAEENDSFDQGEAV